MQNKFVKTVAAALIIFVSFSAVAATWGDAEKRINVFYQYDGGAKDAQGRWDKLIAPYIYKWTSGKHSTIYYDSSTSKYITGRACCLLSYSNAYQYLCGRASTEEEQLEILLTYLQKKPVWSNTGSSISPPNARSLYHSVLMAQSGIVSVSTSAVNSFAKLETFFEGLKGVLIVNGTNHYRIAVGCTTYNGVEYVQLVDSVLTGTIASGKLSKAYSMDFSAVYTASNSTSYNGIVRQYWVPYSYFTSGKLTIVYAYLNQKRIIAPSCIVIEAGKTISIDASVYPSGSFVLESCDSSIATVSGASVTGIAPGVTYITCCEDKNPSVCATIPVYCVEISTDKLIVGTTDAESLVTGNLPSGCRAVLDKSYPYGVFSAGVSLLDPSGQEFAKTQVLLVNPDPDATLKIADNVKKIEASAFENVSASFVFTAADDIDESAFSGNDITAIVVKADDGSMEIVP